MPSVAMHLTHEVRHRRSSSSVTYGSHPNVSSASVISHGRGELLIEFQKAARGGEAFRSPAVLVSLSVWDGNPYGSAATRLSAS
jgi:hypothetical protein